ncbi:MAG: MFS transporter [Bacillota bacterium]|nr:MFS transporter [Bacillota bacterium]
MEKIKSTHEQKLIICVVVITAFITTFTGSALNLSIPDIGDEFGVSAGTVGWLVTGYTLAVAAFSVPFGRLADITCRKTVLVTGIAVFVACCIAAVFSVSSAMLIAVRVIQGIGAAMIFSTNTAVLINAFPGARRGQVLGYSLAATYVGLSAGPVAGGFLNHNLGWRSIFILTGVLGAAALAAAAFKLPAQRSDDGGKGRSMDASGNILYILFIVLLMYGLSEIAKGTLPVIMTAAGIVFGIAFVRHELKVSDPAVKIRLFRENIGYAFSNLSALMNYGATFAISYLISIYLQIIMGFTSQTAGLIMICQPVIMAVLTPAAGKASDRFSPFRMSSLGMAFCAVGTFVFIFVNENTSLAVIIAALAVTGLGFSLFSSPNTNAVMSCVQKEDYGVASSVLATMRSIGHTLSMVIVTIVVTRFMPAAALSEAQPEVLVKVINFSFIIFTVICAAGVFISLKRGFGGGRECSSDGGNKGSCGSSSNAQQEDKHTLEKPSK